MVKSKFSPIYSGAIMASGLCFHFFGNELARAASVSLISTKEIGLGSSALTYTVLFGFPSSALTLYLYTSSIKSRGAASTFRMSCLICLTIFIGMTYATSTNILRQKNVFSQFIVVAFYAFREIYSTLLSTQQWAFIVSALDHTTASYIVTFSGAVSIISTMGGISVEHVVTTGGVNGLLSVSSLAVLLTIVSSELAFWSHNSKSGHSGDKAVVMKERQKGKERSTTVDLTTSSSTSNNDTPINHGSKSTDISNNSSSTTTNNNNNNNKHERTLNRVASEKKEKVGFSMWNDSMRLLTNSTLQLLVVEAVVHQSCSNMLNIMFYDGLRHVITADDTRAVLVGRFFATVNFSSCLLQFFVVPYVLTQKTLPTVMMYIPVLVCLATALCSAGPSLLSVMLSFGVLKVLEYAVLAGAMEMIYMPLDSETRYLGKEYVRFFGSKLGKTGASLALTTLTAHIRPSLTTQCLWSLSLAVAWAGVMTLLASHLSDKISAADAAHSKAVSQPEKETVPMSPNSVSEQEPTLKAAANNNVLASEVQPSSPRSQKQVPVPPIGAFNIAWDDLSSVSRKRSRTMSVCDADYSFMFSPADILGALSEEDADTSDESEPSETPRNPLSASMRKRSTSSHSFPHQSNRLVGSSGQLTELTTSLSGNLLVPPAPSPRRALLRSLRRSRKKTIVRVRSRSEPLSLIDGSQSSSQLSDLLNGSRVTSSGIPRSVSGILRMSHEQGAAPRSYEEYRALFGNLDGGSGVSCKVPISFSEFGNLAGSAVASSEARVDDEQSAPEMDRRSVSEDAGRASMQAAGTEATVGLVPSVSNTNANHDCIAEAEAGVEADADATACDKTDDEPYSLTPDSLNGFSVEKVADCAGAESDEGVRFIEEKQKGISQADSY